MRSYIFWYAVAMTAKDFTARFRLDADTWRRYGQLVGDRERSAALAAFVEGQVSSTEKMEPERTVQLLVTIRIGPQGRQADVVEIPGGDTSGRQLKAEVAQAIADHFKRQGTRRS